MINTRRAACEKMADKLDAQIIREYVGHCGGLDSIDQRPTLQHMLHELDTELDTERARYVTRHDLPDHQWSLDSAHTACE